MSFADRIRHCNSYDPAQAIPLWAGEHRIGWLRRDNAGVLARLGGTVFAVETDRARLLADGDTDTVSRAVDGVVDKLVAERLVPKWRNETFDVAPLWGEKPIFRLDRGAVPFFGVRAYGVHLNGYRRIGGQYWLWVGKRASNKQVSPGKLDNMVAGGIGNGYAALATLAKEAEEEAGVTAELVARATAAGALTYRMATKLGVRDDVMFVYDLEAPEDFTPSNGDGEIAGFELMPLATILERIRTTSDFKFNVNLVILDFAVRHGVLRPDDPEYLDVVNGLHRPLD
jgi:8-oxo-dGTP pyrophosphatase MutT (NUDIX family)